MVYGKLWYMPIYESCQTFFFNQLFGAITLMTEGL